MRGWMIGVALGLGLGSLLGGQVAEKVGFSIPSFSSGVKAAEWARQRVSSAAKGDGKSQREALLSAAAAYRKARKLVSDDDPLRFEAAIEESEVFLRLSSPANAIKTLDSEREGGFKRAGVSCRLFERAGESAEMLGSDGATQTYERALSEAKDPGWRALVLYRRGMTGARKGPSTFGLARLEEAIAAQESGSRRAVHLQAELARGYAGAGDPARAGVWLKEAKGQLSKGLKTDADEVVSFIPAPSVGELQNMLQEVEASLSRR